jgi:hypothetical protein
MKSLDSKNRIACPSPDISAYLDGELSPADELRLESHLAGCKPCVDDLNLQKSFLNALDYSLETEDKIELPQDFTRSVVANAESRVTGLRRPRERRNAAVICAALIVVSLFALGSSAEKTFIATAVIVDQFLAVIISAGHLSYDLALGSAIIFRSLTSKFLFESGITMFAYLTLFLLSLYSFSRLLVRFHRAGHSKF